MYHKSYFLYDQCYGISSDRKVLSSKYVMNLGVRVDRSSDYLGFHLFCFSIWICVGGAWTSLPIPLVTKAYMTKSRSWLEHILSSSSSWCWRLGCSWSFHHCTGVVIISQFALPIIAHPLILRLGWVLPGAA